VLVVYGPRENVDSVHRALLGRVIERGAHVPIITNDEPGETTLGAAHDMLDGFTRPHKARVVPNRAAAIQFALSEAKLGDAVLIAGRGDRATRPSNAKRPAYDDREVACQWLYGAGERELSVPRFRVVG